MNTSGISKRSQVAILYFLAIGWNTLCVYGSYLHKARPTPILGHSHVFSSTALPLSFSSVRRSRASVHPQTSIRFLWGSRSRILTVDYFFDCCLFRNTTLGKTMKLANHSPHRARPSHCGCKSHEPVSRGAQLGRSNTHLESFVSHFLGSSHGV